MLRKSPYTEENYNYIVSMMDNMKLQENLFNQSMFNNNNNNMSMQPSSDLWSSNQNSNANFFNMKDIDTKKKIETETSVYDKTRNLLNQGALNVNMNLNNQIQQNPTPMFCEMNNRPVKCFGCLKENNNELMQVEDNMGGSLFSECNYCRNVSCNSCTRRCDLCGRGFCKICVNVRYEEYMDRIVCLYCSY